LPLAIMGFACVSGTNLDHVLKAQTHLRYCPICLDDRLSHHAEQLLPPDQPSASQGEVARSRPVFVLAIAIDCITP
jgi:hypothetical protein